MQLQAIVRGFLLRKKLKISKCQPDLNYFDDNQQNNITNNNINISNHMDIISQSTITAKKKDIITNNLDKITSIMNFNPNVSKSIECNLEEIQDKYLNINLVSYYKIFNF